jgi:hypothetical protein
VGDGWDERGLALLVKCGLLLIDSLDFFFSLFFNYSTPAKASCALAKRMGLLL